MIISELLHRMEQGFKDGGWSDERAKAEANDIAVRLLIAGQRTVYAGNDAQAPSRRLVDQSGRGGASEVVTHTIRVGS
jgi:hypothetical protein